VTRFLRPAVRCPKCSATPRWRVSEGERDRYEDAAPELIVASIQCHRCHEVYPIHAAAIQRAA
jgi:uncharacterized protein YbaR (Trm112 family)